MKRCGLFMLTIMLVLLAVFSSLRLGRVAELTSADLSGITGSQPIPTLDCHILARQVCDDDPPSGDDGCYAKKYIVPYAPYYEYRCEGSCADICVADGIRKWCKPQNNAECDTSMEQSCDGDLYVSAAWTGCWGTGFWCNDCEYADSGDDC